MECVSGCDGGSLPSNAEVIGVAAALVSLAVAFYAVKIARGSLEIAKEQHEEFLRDLRARANFELHISAPGSGGVIETNAARLKIVWGIKIENVGDKPARHVSIAFAAPQFLRDMQWVEGEGESILSQKGGPHLVRDLLVDSQGASHKVQTMTKIADQIGRVTRFAQVSGVLELPNVGDEQAVPVKLIAASDDLPEDVENVTATNEIVVRRV